MTTDPAERFEALYREHYAAVLRYAARRTDASSAEEIAAETFAVAWRRLHRVPGGGDTLPWLLVTARNTLSNRRRAQTRDETKARDHGPPPSARDPADAVAERDAVRTALRSLSHAEKVRERR